MNTPTDNEHPDLRFAEYVLGVLGADERAAVEREVAASEHAAAEVARWQQHLLPLAEDVEPAPPPAGVWTRIESELGFASTPTPTPTSTRQAAASALRSGWWNSVALWRGFAFGAAAVAAACIIALVIVPRTAITPPPAATLAYMTSTITQSNGQVGWTATMDLRHARIVVVPAKPQRIVAGHAPELWLIPAGHKPIAVGMIAANAATTMALSPALLAQLGPTAALAVSVEPPGGSPTGQPTGPVIAQGAIGAAAQQHAASKPVARIGSRQSTHASA